MTIKEWRKDFESYINALEIPRDDYKGIMGYINDGYSIMEQAMKQKPVSPKVDIDTYVCGVCGTRLERQSMIGVNVVVSEFLDYCPVCGQAVKWE